MVYATRLELSETQIGLTFFDPLIAGRETSTNVVPNCLGSFLNQECHKRWFQWRHANRLTLHFSIKAEIVTHGLLKMCPRLEPQRHFEAACCSGIAISAVARVSCMSVCKTGPRPKPQHHFEVQALKNALSLGACRSKCARMFGGLLRVI